MKKTQEEIKKEEKKVSKNVFELLKETNISLLLTQDMESFEDNGTNMVTYKRIEDMF